MDCPDCNVKPGEIHHPCCDVERCAFCGHQAMSCACWLLQLGLPANHDDEPTDEEWETWLTKQNMQGRIPWSGEWPNMDTCREYGFFCYEDSDGYGDPEMHYGHIPCSPDHPEAHPDLNRLHDECVWDKGLKKMVLRVNSE